LKAKFPWGYQVYSTYNYKTTKRFICWKTMRNKHELLYFIKYPSVRIGMHWRQTRIL